MERLLFTVMSWKHKVVSGSYSRIFLEVYSDTLRKAWNAVSMAAHNITLSLNLTDEFQSVCPRAVRSAGVIGTRGGLLNVFPWVRFIPLITRYSRLCRVGSGS